MSTARLVLLVLTAALVSIPTAGARSVPRLTLSDRPALTVIGRGFAGGEHVRVTTRIGAAAHTRLVRARPKGTFVALFRDMRVKPCGAIRVTARGDRGSSASLSIATACVP